MPGHHSPEKFPGQAEPREGAGVGGPNCPTWALQSAPVGWEAGIQDQLSWDIPGPLVC